MKLRTILFTVLMTLTIVTGAFADVTYFTCDSNPADFNGKTFDKLYVFIDGCKNFDSTVIPGEEAFVTLKDIEVTGSLFFGDDYYDAATGEYTDADFNDTTKHADTYLNIIGNSYIEFLQTQCVFSHNCNLGLQFPTKVIELDAYLLNKKANGKTVIRGNIDPFIADGTDYYNDTVIASHPEFDIKTFDLEFVKPVLEDPANFALANYAAVLYGQDLLYPYGLRNFLNSGLVSEEIANVFRRAYVNDMYVATAFDVEPGDVEIDLANIEIGNFSNTRLDSNVNWSPIVMSKGFTTISTFLSGTSFTTDVYAPAPYDYTSDDLEKMVLPLYIDLMILGGSGQKITYDMNYTHITVMNYAGNEDSNSLLDLNLGKAGNAITMPYIGIANIMGGKFDMSCEQSVIDTPSIEKLNFYEGIADYQYGENPWDTFEALYFNRPDCDDYRLYNLRVNDEGTGLTDDETTAALREKRAKLYEDEILTLDNIFSFVKTTDGYFTVTATLDGMIKPGNVDMSGKSAVSFYGQNLSLGDIAVSKNLGEITSWMDGSCNFWQHGTRTMIIERIN